MLKTSSPNSPWAYIREGLLLHLRFGGLIFGRAFFGGGGGGGLVIEILRYDVSITDNSDNFSITIRHNTFLACSHDKSAKGGTGFCVH